jgi:hypothetical protein
MVKPKEKTPKIAFVDTNVFLHFTPADQMDLSDIAEGRPLHLVVCVPVVRELDQKKHDPRLGERARKALRMIEDMDGKEIQPGVMLVVYPNDPQSADANVDQQIIRASVEYSQGGREAAVIMTDDTAMRILCRAREIDTVEPPESERFKPPSELDDLKRELAELKNRQPKLSVSLAEGEDLEVPEDFAPVDVEEALEKAVKDWNAEIGNDRAVRVGDPLDKNLYSSYSYQLDVKFWATERMSWFEKTGCVFDFEILVENGGSADATNVRLWVSFPKYVTVVGRHEVKGPPQFKSPREAASAAGARGQVFAGLKRKPKTTVPDGVRIIAARDSADGRCHIEAEFPRISHTMRGTTGAGCLIVPFHEDVHPFDAEYDLLCSEIPRRQSGKLTFKLRMPPDVEVTHFDARRQ